MPIIFNLNEVVLVNDYFDHLLYTKEEQKLMTEEHKEEIIYWSTMVPNFILLKRLKKGNLYKFKNKDYYFLYKKEMDMEYFIPSGHYVLLFQLPDKFKITKEEAYKYLHRIEI